MRGYKRTFFYVGSLFFFLVEKESKKQDFHKTLENL